MTKSSDIVWSVSTRMIHWTVAIIVLLNAFIIEEGDPPHRYLGYLAVVLVLVRFIIGIKGRQHEKFVNFPIGFQKIKLFFETHFKKTHQFPGHNPPASLVYFSIWIAVIALAVTGWMMGLDVYFGEEWLEDLHIYISNGLLVLVALHLVGIGTESIIYKRKAWMSMFTGRKDK